MELLGLQQLLVAAAGAPILIVGDLMVDRFVYGEVNRLSAEAPVPVLAHAREAVMLGAAGNVARNVAALGGRALVIGIAGDDGPGEELSRLIESEPSVEGRVITDPSRPTTVKTRYVAAGQQLLRVDVENAAPAAPRLERRLIDAIGEGGEGARAILLSDYGKGVATAGVIEACRAAAQSAGAVFIVDSKARGFARYGAADVVKPNAAELSYATNLPTTTDAEVEAALAAALSLCECRAILVTRSARGMSLGIRGGQVRHFRRRPAEVFDTSGAGDTALAALGLGLAAGGDLETAAELALLASSIVVEKAGTASVEPNELMEAEQAAHRAPAAAKIAGAARMVREAARWRERGLKIGFTNGCFDILHPGHVAYLGQARGWCDRLVVGLNTDRSVRAIKGAGRPVNGLEARSLVLAGLSCIDLVVPFDEDTPRALIEALRPDILVKGGDYADVAVIGHDLVEAYGGEVRLATFVDGHSTTATISRLSERA